MGPGDCKAGGFPMRHASRQVELSTKEGAPISGLEDSYVPRFEAF